MIVSIYECWELPLPIRCKGIYIVSDLSLSCCVPVCMTCNSHIYLKVGTGFTKPVLVHKCDWTNLQGLSLNRCLFFSSIAAFEGLSIQMPVRDFSAGWWYC